MNDVRPTRILWQSSTAIDDLPVYRRAIEAHAQRVLGARAALAIRGVARGVPELHFRSIDFLNNVEIMRSVLSARGRVDAVAIGCFLDPVLDELREILDVPVLGLAESAMHVACLLGRRFAILTRTGAVAPKFHEHLVEKYGLSRRCAGVFPFELGFQDLIGALEGHPQGAIAALERIGAEASAAGADTLIIGCGVLNLVAAQQGLREIACARVIDTTATLLTLTDSMVRLQTTAGVQVSRKGLYAAPQADVLARALRTYGLADENDSAPG